MITFERLLDPSYADGINEPRVASDGSPLPSARDVSLALAPDNNKPNRRYTLMVMQLGQFIDHDLTHTASTRSEFHIQSMSKLFYVFNFFPQRMITFLSCVVEKPSERTHNWCTLLVFLFFSPKMIHFLENSVKNFTQRVHFINIGMN